MLHVDTIDLFYGASRALNGVSIIAEVGKVTCILGRNGVGKTSLLRAIGGQQKISAGSIKFDNTEISKLSSAERARRGIAVVPQGREIFSALTVQENLQTGYACLPRAERRIEPELYQLFPVLKTMLHRRGGDLSGGQQQQLAIARALVTKPKLLLMDEPTEGIQPSIIKDIERVINLLRERGNVAIVLVEQYFEFAKKLADSFIILNRGSVVAKGDATAIKQDDIRQHLVV